MATPFRNLEERFNANVQKIYHKFSADSSQYVQTTPDNVSSAIKNDLQSLPIESTKRDTQRISKFLKSGQGVLFIAKQTLLQTGNTFAETRLYNPASSLINTVPFLHSNRNIAKGITGFLGLNDTAFRTNRGLLQQETINSYTASVNSNNAVTSDIKSSLYGNLLSRISQYTTQVNVLRNTLSSAILGTASGTWTSPTVRPEFKFITDKNNPNDPNPKFFDKGDALPLDGSYRNRGIIKNTLITIQDTVSAKFNTSLVYGKNARNYIWSNLKLPTGIKLPTTATPLEASTGQVTYNNFSIDSGSLDKLTELFYTTGSTITYNQSLKKFMDQKISGKNGNTPDVKYSFYEDGGINNTEGYIRNKIGGTGPVDNRFNPTPKINFFPDTNTTDYSSLFKNIKDKITGETNPDIVNFIFSVDDIRLRFRAFLSSIKQTVTPEFNEQRYVGRTERFVTYAGVKRTVNLSFQVVAFSVDEIDTVWTRINYLTGLAFPKGISASGFIVPPLFKLTAGGIYENQPCYINNLDFVFLDDKITFDVDKGVSQVIDVTMQITLLEKRTKVYDSPFYAIVEKNNKSTQPPTPAPNSGIVTV